MTTSADWSKGFARQADADFRTWQKLQGASDVAECHRLLFLQMACEKLCKAHRISAGAHPDELQRSHRHIAKNLPTIIKQQITLRQKNVRKMEDILHAVRHLSEEIEVLNPAVTRNGRRRDNCEYPWQDRGGTLHSPLDWSFYPSQLLTAPRGRSFVKLLELSIKDLL